MLAAVLKELRKPLCIEEVETPSPGPDEVLVQVMACGTDATDLKMIDGFGYAPDLPFITGHEIAGVAAELGGEVTDFKPGDRVVAHNFFTCGKCLLCRTNREQLCIDMSGVMGARINTAATLNTSLFPLANSFPCQTMYRGRMLRCAATPVSPHFTRWIERR